MINIQEKGITLRRKRM